MCEYLVFIELVQSLKNSYLGSVADSSRFFILQQSAGVSSAEMSETEMAPNAPSDPEDSVEVICYTLCSWKWVN